MQCNYHSLWDNLRHHPVCNHFSCSKNQKELFLFCAQKGNQDRALHYMLKSDDISVTKRFISIAGTETSLLWQCRSPAFNIPCKKSSKKPQQGFPSLLLLAVAFKLGILPLVRDCVMLQLASPYPAMSPADSDPELYPNICIPGLTFWLSHHCGLVQWYGLLATINKHTLIILLSFYETVSLLVGSLVQMFGFLRPDHCRTACLWCSLTVYTCYQENKNSVTSSQVYI